jgi:acyl carrier protein
MDEILALLEKVRPEINYSASLDYLEEGLLDSFDIVTLVADLDAHYGISIPGTEIIPENFRNAEAILALVQKYHTSK